MDYYEVVHSYQHTILAVELYIKQGKRVGPTIRQRGHPTKNELKDWHREYQERLDLLVGYAGGPPKFSQTQKSITDIFELNHRCYGYRRLQASLTRQDVTISEKVVQRLRKQLA